MGEHVDELAQRLDLDIPHLRSAYDRTISRLDERRRALAQLDADDDAAVVFVGSWGRHEVTAQSDNDFFVLTRADDRDGVRPSADEVKQTLRAAERDFRDPGKRGHFGGEAVCFADLHRLIGTMDDDNMTLTRRMLLVLESVALRNEGVHESARDELIRHYLEPPVKPQRPPRLFLNDVIRYWRTMCVDFAGKMRERRGQGWGLRNAKLRTTRKMLFASGLLPLLRCHELTTDEIEPFLVDQFALPPGDRVAAAFLHYGQDGAARKVFQAYDEFLALLEDRPRRNELDSIQGRPEADDSRPFQAAAQIGDGVQNGLLELLFSPRLEETTRQFAIF